MKIYCNENNPFGLKLLILAKLAQRTVEVHKIKLDDNSGKEHIILPVFELDNGLKLFSTVAVAKYLFPNESIGRDEWLEWSVTVLAPALYHLAAGQRVNQNALSAVNACLQKIDSHFKNNEYLVGKKLTAADISVWSLLSADETLKNAHNSENLSMWYRKISELRECREAIATSIFKNLSVVTLQNSNRYGGLTHIQINILTNNEQVLSEPVYNIAHTISAEEKNTARVRFIHSFVPHPKASITVLPKAEDRNILITSALPYVNNVPHLGNIIGCVLSADIFARYCRAAGYNTLYISGTDEYGTATENKAIVEKLTPKQICDKYFEIHNTIYRWFGIGFDFFGRTTAPEQTEIVQEAFKNVLEADYITTETVDQLMCQKCDRFLADRFVEGTCPLPGCGYEDARGDQCDKCGKLVNAIELIRPRCKTCNTTPVIKCSQQLFLNLPKIEPKLKEWIDKVDHGWTNNARVITRAWLREGLKPRCITRDLKWGIPVPYAGFEQKVFYVWFDAPFGYVSMTKRYTKDYQQWWNPKPNIKVELFQFMAKDNVPFHTVMWPSALLASGNNYTLVEHIMATEYLNYEEVKFSKSRGIGIFGNDVIETGIPADIWRFYLASVRPESQDSSFSWIDMATRNNSELLNNLGNFVNRALVFCEKNFQKVVPEMILNDEDVTLLALINRELQGYYNSLEKAKLRDGIRHFISISKYGNGYMQSQQPWVLVKGKPEQKIRAGTIIGICVNLACWLANLIFPFMPTTARALLQQLNTEQIKLDIKNPSVTILLPTGHKINKPVPLFNKLDMEIIENLKKKYSGQETSPIKNAAPDNVEELRKLIEIQGNKVRQLKASTKDKKVWQPEVAALLSLKEKLIAAEKNSSTPVN